MTGKESVGKHRVVVVVGPGRSGTSALTRGIQALGVELGDKLKAAAPKNAFGFFEDLDLLDVNHRLHEAFGLKRNGSSLQLIEDRQWQTLDLQPFQQQAIKIVEQRFAHIPIWGLKSGGILRLLPFWEGVFQYLDLDVCYVMAIRNPLSVARSRSKLDALRGAQENSDLEWLVRVVPYFRVVTQHRFVVVDYDRLMSDAAGQLARVANALDLPVGKANAAAIREYAEGFLDDRQRHNRVDARKLDVDARLNPLTRQAYRWLYRLSRDELGSGSGEFWVNWRGIERALQQMAPVLRHLDFLDTRIRGPRWGSDGAWRTIMQHIPRRAVR